MGVSRNLPTSIVKLIPKDHDLYAEPFIGGGAVFFEKEVSKIEVINDTNKELINFYRTVQNDFVSLEKEIRITLHSRDLHRKAGVIYNNPDMFPELKRAWAVWTLAHQSFSGKLNGHFGYDRTKKNTSSRRLANKRDSFTEELAIRLQEVQIECTDALRIITSRDHAKAFFYCDPPYYNSNMGHYDGYTIEDFTMLLTNLSKIQGKFLLSSYPSDILKTFIKEHGWSFVTFDQPVSVSNGAKGRGKRKIEQLTANYDLKAA